MAREIKAAYTTGKVVYAQLLDATGRAWNTALAAFEVWATANVANYALTMTEQGTASQLYMGALPAVPAGLYHVVARERAGGTPAESDAVVGAGTYDWDGSALVPVGTLNAGAVTAAKFAADAVDANALAASATQEIADALLDRADAVETGYTPRKALRLILAALAGKLSGAATATITIRNVTDTKDRITATVDASGNRGAVGLDAS